METLAAFIEPILGAMIIPICDWSFTAELHRPVPANIIPH
jgi:hypothetical protein